MALGETLKLAAFALSNDVLQGAKGLIIFGAVLRKLGVMQHFYARVPAIFVRHVAFNDLGDSPIHCFSRPVLLFILFIALGYVHAPLVRPEIQAHLALNFNVNVTI
jgi:hypothetical protein